MKSPRNVKEIQRLTGCLSSLNRFISRMGDKYKPFFETMKKVNFLGLHNVKGKRLHLWTLKSIYPTQQLCSTNPRREVIFVFGGFWLSSYCSPNSSWRAVPSTHLLCQPNYKRHQAQISTSEETCFCSGHECEKASPILLQSSSWGAYNDAFEVCITSTRHDETFSKMVNWAQPVWYHFRTKDRDQGSSPR